MDFTSFPETTTPPSIVTTSNAMARMYSYPEQGSNASFSGRVWPSANLAIYQPLILPYHYTVRRLVSGSGTLSGTPGHYCIGIYNSAGVLLYSSGSVTLVTNAAPQIHTMSSPLKLIASQLYFLGYSVDNVADQIVWSNGVAANQLQVIGIYEQTSAFPLPSTATFSTISNACLPYIGVSRVSGGGLGGYSWGI